MAEGMFAERRARLMELLGGGAAIFAAGHETLRNGDVEHEYRQPSTFYYLTGFEEPDAVAVLRPGHDEPFALFVRPHDPAAAIWVGQRAGVEGAQEHFGADVAYPIEELEEQLPELLSEVDTIHFSLGGDEEVQALVSEIVASRRGAAVRGGRAIERVCDPFPLVAGMRLVKSEAEIALLQRAIDVTGAGIEAAVRATRPGMHEYEVQAVLEAEYRRLGSPRNGFPSIVASGANSCTLHYTSNRRRIEDGDLLLLDTGAEIEYYGADVTRTIPANGAFSAEQRAVYDIVLAANRAGIERCATGATIEDVHAAATEVVVRGLVDLKVLSGDVEALIEEKAHRPYFMHSTSHWLGLDVHDVGAYKSGDAPTELLPGMVLTVEPGIYLAPDAEGVPEPLRGIGIRIEDDVLVTADGPRNLSGGIPSDAAALEELVGAL